MRVSAISLKSLRVRAMLAVAAGLALALGLSAVTSANIRHNALPAVPTTSLAYEAAPGPPLFADDGPRPLSHKERIALFAKRVALFRQWHPRLSIAGPQRRFASPSPIVRGKTDRECLTQAVYYEARGEAEAGQVAVAQVVMNRSRAGSRYPSSLCGVVFQGAARPGCQFSFACEGARQAGPVSAVAWARADKVAQQVMAGEAAGDIRATHYHTAAVSPLWDRSIAKLAQIGRHIFFGERTATAAPPEPPITAAAGSS